jgi:hypothetical protein
VATENGHEGFRLVKAASMGRMCLPSKGLASANKRLADDNNRSQKVLESYRINRRPVFQLARDAEHALAPAASLWYGLTTHIRAHGCTLYLS